MAQHLLDLSAAPTDPVPRIMWLTGVHEQVNAELEAALADAYFEARFQGILTEAVAAGPYSMKRALKLTRGENRRRGSAIRWGDDLDPTSR